MNKQFNSLALLAIAGASIMSSCSKETDLYDSNLAQKEYEQNWTETFGDVAADQDWNTATRATANVNLDGEYVVKVYTSNPINSDSRLMAKYTVNGSTTFQFDAPKSQTDVFVKAEDANGNLAINSYVSLSNGTLNIDNTTKAATRAGETCNTTIDTDRDELYVTCSQYDDQTAIKDASGNYATITGSFYYLKSVKTEEGSEWKTGELKKILGSDGVFAEGADNVTKWKNNLNFDFVYEMNSDGPVTLDLNYCCTNSTTNKIGYFFYTGDMTAEKLAETDKYILVDNPAASGYVKISEYTSDHNGGYYYNDYKNLGATNANWIFGQYGNNENKLKGTRFHLAHIDDNGNSSFYFPKGTKIAFFLVRGSAGSSIGNRLYYSISSLNPDNDVKVATYNDGETTFLGFEDWGGLDGSGSDLNDVMFFANGDFKKPEDVDPDPTPTDQGQSWIVACEDLGSTDDYDFNDIVFKVTHVSGANTATITPLAAGGTLKAEIYNGNTCIGEIHEMLGNGSTNENGLYNVLNASNQKSGYYVVDRSNLPSATDVQLGVDGSSFTMSNVADGGSTNMGGFSIKVTKDGTTNESVTINAPTTGSVPQMFCISDNLNWEWPTENTHIGTAYPEFNQWVGDTSYSTWYNNPAAKE